MGLKIKHYISLILGIVIVIIDIIFFFSFKSPIGPKVWYFSPIIVIGALIGSIAFIIDFMEENKRQKELETKFLEFVRSLVETVRSGATIPQAILHVSNVNYGSLTPYVQKLARQIEWGYTLHDALTIFANDTDNSVVKRSIAIVIEAEESGGDIGSVLEAVTGSVLEIKKIKEERKSNAYTQTIQGYIIYFFFVFIMIVLQVYLIPKLGTVGGELGQGLGTIGISGLGGGSTISFDSIFIATIIVQGLFAGLMLGKFAEGDYKSGLKHSLIMVIGGYLIITTAAGIVKPQQSLILLIPYYFMKKDNNVK